MILDELAGWIVDNIRWVTDQEQYGERQYWATPEETLSSKCGDCDCRAVLFAQMAFEKVGYRGYFITSSSPSPAEGHVSIAFAELPVGLLFLTGERERPWIVSEVFNFETAMRIVQESRGRNIGPVDRPNAITLGKLDLTKLAEYAKGEWGENGNCPD